jgi:hypothetical protein
MQIYAVDRIRKSEPADVWQPKLPNLRVRGIGGSRFWDPTLTEPGKFETKHRKPERTRFRKRSIQQHATAESNSLAEPVRICLVSHACSIACQGLGIITFVGHSPIPFIAVVPEGKTLRDNISVHSSHRCKASWAKKHSRSASGVTRSMNGT